MCGRYVSKMEAVLEREWALIRPPNLFESFNVAPTTQVPIVFESEAGRESVMMRWGLVPFWAKGIPTKFATHNATIERMKTAPTYRGPWKRGHRCLFPVNGFYEWQKVAGQKKKQPWYIHLLDEPLFGLAGLWDRSVGDDGLVVESATILTMPANERLAEIYNTKKRMPVIIRPSDYETWLTGSTDEAEATMKPFLSNAMHAYRVGNYVNERVDDGRCIEPLDPDSLSQQG